MENRFKFNAIVSSYYDIDTPDDYKEFEPKFYLKNVDVFCTGEIGIDYDTLLESVKEQSKNLTEKEIGQIMQHFEDNSNSPDCDFVTITPDKILQSTGLKDKNGKIIFEGDVVRYASYVIDGIEPDWEYTEIVWGGKYNYPALDVKNNYFDCNGLSYIFNEDYVIEVVGNIYENKIEDLIK